ncbi:MAG: amidohydrolase [Desulfobacterales bacterium]|nr:amidohydrolase [Desulfobacterales bacterium]
MIIDSHFHLAPEEITTRQIIAAMDEHGIRKTALIAKICGPIEEPGQGLLSLMRFAMQRAMTRHLVKPFVSRFTEQGEVKLPGGAVPIDPDPDNEAVFEAVGAYPNRFLGWAFVNPHGIRSPLKELTRWEAHPGFIGAKAHPFWHRYPPMALASVAARLEQTGSPLLIHLGFGKHGKLKPLVEAFPRMNVIVAHAGVPYYQHLWREFKENKNIYFDLSANAFVTPTIMKQVVEFLGPERCIFGTDGPFGPKNTEGFFDHGYMMGLIEKTFPDEGVQRQLLGGTFREVTGLM